MKRQPWYPQLRTIEDEHAHLRVALGWLLELNDQPKGRVAEKRAIEFARYMLAATNPNRVLARSGEVTSS